MTRAAQPKKITGQKAADILGISVGWLAHLRADSKGPPHHKEGRSVFYYQHEVEAHRDAGKAESKPLMVVELKTLTMRPDGKGGHSVEINGQQHAVPAGATTLLVTEKPTKRGK